MASDADLYRRWRKTGDEAAFEALALRHATLVADVAYRIGGDQGLAEDALQESLLALAVNGTDRPAKVGVRGWLARAAMSKARNARASQTARARREKTASRARLEAEMNTPARDLRAALRDVLTRLDGEDAALLSLRYVHGLPSRDVATILGISEANARVRVHRALRKARTTVGASEADEDGVVAALSALPAFSLPEASVQAAWKTAVHAARSGVPEGRGPGPSVSAVRAVFTAATFGLVVIAGILTWRSLIPPEEHRDRVAQVERPGDAPTLRGRAGSPDRSLAHAKSPAARAPHGSQGGTPPKVAIARGTQEAPARLSLPALVPVKVRMELVSLDGSTEEVHIEKVLSRGSEFAGSALREQPDLLRTRPGWSIVLTTKDPRVAIPVVILRVPDPVPETIVATLPRVGDPRLTSLTLEVVDEATGEPLPDAVLHRGQGELEHALVRADAEGRIRVPSSTSDAHAARSGVALLTFASQEWTVDAPGHIGVGFASGSREFIPAVAAEDLATWLETGTKRIALPAMPDSPHIHERTVQLLDEEGRPVSGVYVYIAHPVKDRSGTPLHRELGADGCFRRTDERGLFRIVMAHAVALAVSNDRVQVAAWGLSEEGWAGAGPRELRMPMLTSAEVTLTGLPEGKRGLWVRDPEGPWRRSGLGPLLRDGMDAEALRYLEAHHATFLMPDFLRGDLMGPDALLKLPLAVGRTEVIHLRVGEQERLLELRATGREPVTLRREWGALPPSK